MYPKIIRKTIRISHKSFLNHLFFPESHPRKANFCYLVEIKWESKIYNVWGLVSWMISC